MRFDRCLVVRKDDGEFYTLAEVLAEEECGLVHGARQLGSAVRRIRSTADKSGHLSGDGFVLGPLVL